MEIIVFHRLHPLHRFRRLHLRQLTRRLKPLADGQRGLRIDRLPLAADDKVAIRLGGIVADRNVTALLETVWDRPAILAVIDPIKEVATDVYASDKDMLL